MMCRLVQVDTGRDYSFFAELATGLAVPFPFTLRGRGTTLSIDQRTRRQAARVRRVGPARREPSS
jgi:hypothetical protein